MQMSLNVWEKLVEDYEQQSGDKVGGLDQGRRYHEALAGRPGSRTLAPQLVQDDQLRTRGARGSVTYDHEVRVVGTNADGHQRY